MRLVRIKINLNIFSRRISHQFSVSNHNQMSEANGNSMIMLNRKGYVFETLIFIKIIPLIRFKMRFHLIWEHIRIYICLGLLIKGLMRSNSLRV